MRHRRNFLLLLGLLVLLASLPGSASATLYMFLNVEGASQGLIPGDATLPGYENWIEVSSFSHGVFVAPGVNGQPSGPPSVSDLSLTKGFDRSILRILRAQADQERLSSFTLEIATDSPLKMSMPIYRIELVNAYVSSAQESGSAGELPYFSLSFSYERVIITDIVEGTSVAYDWSPFAASAPETASKGILLPATPNPTRGSTEFRFSLPGDSDAELTLYDLRGHLVRRLHSGWTPAEGAVAVWDGTDDAGSRAPQGVYMARLSYPGHEITQRITLLR